MYYNNVTYICNVINKQLEIMTTLKTENRTFNKTVKSLIATNLNKVVSFKKVDSRCVRLIGKDGNTIALWNQTLNGSEVVLNSWY